MDPTPHVTTNDIRAGIRALELAGRAICVHSSLRSFGWVEGGAIAVIDGFLAEGCTVLAPTFCSAYEIPAPAHLRFARNGWDDAHDPQPTAGIGRIYRPTATEIEREMGAIPAAVLAHPGHLRGNHPINSFAAVGPLADDLIHAQGPLDVYAPFDGLMAADGAILLAGVGPEAMTFIHSAEQHAGRTLFRRWANGPDGEPVSVAVGGCSLGFGGLDPAIAPLAREAFVGASRWRSFPARETLAALLDAIRRDPAITRCGDPDCARCNDAMQGEPVIPNA
jgi:aminoglycoside N3'-acetyltransferase